MAGAGSGGRREVRAHRRIRAARARAGNSLSWRGAEGQDFVYWRFTPAASRSRLAPAEAAHTYTLGCSRVAAS